MPDGNTEAQRWCARPLGVVGSPRHPAGSDTRCRATPDSCLQASALPELFLARAGPPETPGQEHYPRGPGQHLARPPLPCPRHLAGGRRLSSASENPSPDPARPLPGVGASVPPGEGVPGTQGARSAPGLPRCPRERPRFPGEERSAEVPPRRWRAGGRRVPPAPASVDPARPSGATSGGGGGRQRVHVGGLPALHHRLAQDLQVRVRRIVSRGRRPPRGAAVLAGCEDRGRGGGAHAASWTARPGSWGEERPRPCRAFWAGGGREAGRGRGTSALPGGPRGP